jgi:MarR family transcriptional repressor of emrRAB
MISIRINRDPPSRLELLEQSLRSLSVRVPDVPTVAILLSRVIVELGRQLSSLLEHQIRPYGLGEADFRVLSALFAEHEGGAYPSELCERTGQSPANMSRIGDVLVNRNLITRVLSARDRRRMVLRITDEGEALVRRVLPRLFDPLKGMFEDIGETDQLALIQQLKRVGARLGGRPANPIP